MHVIQLNTARPRGPIGRRLITACNESPMKRVRKEANIAAAMSRDIGPPMRIGAPFGTAITALEGSRTGSEQLIARSPMRTAFDPRTVTVLLPKTMIASLSGLTGLGGLGVSLGRTTGFGVLGTGAQEVPGGIRMCPGTCSPFVPVLLAGITPQYMTGPLTAAAPLDATAAIALLR